MNTPYIFRIIKKSDQSIIACLDSFPVKRVEIPKQTLSKGLLNRMELGRHLMLNAVETEDGKFYFSRIKVLWPNTKES